MFDDLARVSVPEVSFGYFGIVTFEFAVAIATRSGVDDVSGEYAFTYDFHRYFPSVSTMVVLHFSSGH